MPSNDNEDIWGLYAKGVRPIKRAVKKLPLPPTKKIKAPLKKEVPALSKPKPTVKSASALFANKKSVSFDKKVERQLRQGDITIDARMDLHGMTQKEAHATLDKFMSAQVKAGHRNLLIITGKGRTGGGVIRENLRNWLEGFSVAPHILSVRSAAIKHGGSGAFYVILKRVRN